MATGSWEHGFESGRGHHGFTHVRQQRLGNAGGSFLLARCRLRHPKVTKKACTVRAATQITIERLGWPEVFDGREPSLSESVLHVVRCEEAEPRLPELGVPLRLGADVRGVLVVQRVGGRNELQKEGGSGR